MNTKEYVDVDGAIAWFKDKGLSMSRPTLNRLRVAGTGPDYLKLGWRVAYPVDGLEAFVARLRRTATTDART